MPDLTIHMLPARHGDALVVEYGDRPHRLLIDGGPRSSATLELLRDAVARAGDEGGFDLVVVTHIDADHITGILKLAEDRRTPLAAGDLWFNGWQHLPTDVLGAKQGEALSAAIRRRRLPWNRAFAEQAVMAPDDEPFPTVDLPGGMTLTVLGPTRRELAALRPVWKREVEKAGLVPGVGAATPPGEPDVLGDRPLDVEALSAEPFVEDDSEANGASIAFLAEFGGSSALFTGDTHATVLTAALRRLASERGVERVSVDAFKLPHHGSRFNLSRELMESVAADRYLFSTNGDIFRHPDPTAVARIVVDRSDCELAFNYRTPETERWDSSRLRRRYRYRTVYPEGDVPGLRVTL
jgi:beta-lactamase superfamily II metal-dependent hydrolase